MNTLRVDWLANVIRSVDGRHELGAGALAEKIIEAIESASPPVAAQDRVAELVAQLAACFKMAGADCDGNEDWRIAPRALQAVTDLRRDYDEACDEAEALRTQLSAALARAEASEADAGLHRAIERAAKELPEGFVISLSVERGSAWVDGVNWDGDGMPEPCPDSSLADQVIEMIDAAITQEAQ